MKKLKILMVTGAFYPDSFGGVQTYVYNLARFLVRRGHSVHVITLRVDKSLPDKEIIDGIEVVRYDSALKGPLLFIMRPWLSIINARKVFRKLIRETMFDIINYHLTLPAFSINISARSILIPKIHTFHSSMSRGIIIQNKKRKHVPHFLIYLIAGIIKRMEKYNLKVARKILVLSQYNKNELMRNYKISSENIIVVSGGVDTKQFVPAEDKQAIRKNIYLDKNSIVFLTVRRLVARMGLECLITAFAKVHRKFPETLLVIGGEGFLEEKLKNLTSQKALSDKVIFTGKLNDQQLKQYYQACDLFVLPTESMEGFGLVTLEALSSGLPVMGTPKGGTREILSKLDTKYIFKGTSSDDIAQGLIRFFKEKKSAEHITQQCRNFVEQNYSWDKVSITIEKVYYQQINGE